MSVGLLIVTHERLAVVIVETVVSMLGRCPLPLAVLPVSGDCDPDEVRKEARNIIETLDEGGGVLMLTDIYGSTASNVASSLVEVDRVMMVSGINLPMLIRVMNYPNLSLPELTAKAVSGGRDGVIACCDTKGA